MPLLYEERGHVAILTLSRPESRNAWCDEFTEGIVERLGTMAKDKNIRCVVLTGDDAGRAFSAGADMKRKGVHGGAPAADFIEKLAYGRETAPGALSEFPKPIIAAVNGYAIGVGCIITLCADLIVASERAQWSLPQVRLGIMPAYGGSVRMSRIVGRNNAFRAAMGYPIDGAEAYRIGLAQWLTPHDKMMAQALEVAENIASMPPLSVRIAKESLVRGQDIPNLGDATFVDAYRVMALQQTEDTKEAGAAARERRKGKFRGV